MNTIAGKTISFPKGKGSIRHNNRDFVADNVDYTRIGWNRTYIKENLTEAYEKCFGESLRAYNARQKRKDRQKGGYISEIKNSGNGEKVFYENVVQIGNMEDTGVIDKNGELTADAKTAVQVLEEYAKTFQSRNPNLYLFNCVLHMDEATPHLHIDYIPVAHGYKNGMETRNSLTKALQQMGFAKAVSKTKNETVAWQERERSYLTVLCKEHGIEIEVLGMKRDNYSLPEYKAIMQKVDTLERQAEALEQNNELLENHNEDLECQVSKLYEQAQEIKMCNQEMALQGEKLLNQLEELEAKEKDNQKILAKHDLRAETLNVISKEVKPEIKKMKSAAVQMNSFFSKEEYVKVKKKDWVQILDAFDRAVSRNYLLETYEKKMAALENRIKDIHGRFQKLEQFVISKGLNEEFVKFSTPKSMKQKMEEARVRAMEYNRQRKIAKTEQKEKNYWQHEL